MSRESIAFYSTSIAAEKTASEIMTLLARAGATAILSEYGAPNQPGEPGKLAAVSFRIKTEFGVLTFRLPANVDGVSAVLMRSTSIPRALRNSRAQAQRVAWRIILHWLDAQLAMIAAGLVDLEQVFLPYAQDVAGVTVYDRIKDSRFKFLNLLPDKT
jgi:hypothetical protein